MKRFCALLLLVCASAIAAAARTEPLITVLWPPEKPALKLTFDRFRGRGSYGGENAYAADVMVENLTDKQIPKAVFTVYFLDKNKIRIGDGTLQVADLEAGQTAKMQFAFVSVGVPASLNLVAENDMLAPPPAKTIPVKILSVPPGAKLKVDGQDSGSTPVIVRLTVGSH